MRTTLTLKELRSALRVADPAAVLVAPQILARVAQQVYGLPSPFLAVPHRHSLVIDRHLLFRTVEPEELDLGPDPLLPPVLILLARPTIAKRDLPARQATLLKYWRRLFHANVHLALEQKIAEGRLTPADIHARVAEVGAVEFQEVGSVLQQDHYLPPHATEAQVYVEFAAVYLELRYFAANLLPVYFPALRDGGRIDALLARDVDADALFARTRLAGAPDPVALADTASDEPNDYYWKLVRRAEKADKAGNTVRAAVLHTTAARVAPGPQTLSTRQDAQDDLWRLTRRLQAALRFGDDEAREWQKDLAALLEKADQGVWTVEARLLYDLQKVCVDHEKEIYALDLVEWFLSAGNRPIQRPLPSQRIVRITKHLRQAVQRLPRVRLADQDRQHFTQLLQNAVDRSEQRLRESFRPVLRDAFHDVGLRPGNPPERVAFQKMLEELLDRTVDYGFFTFSDLRDAVSRNNLKMPDLAETHEYVQGDPLLRLDGRLKTSLDGVYRPSEFYLRWLERVTSLGFGTRIGRWLTLYVLLPFGGALFLMEALQKFLEYKYGPEAVPLFCPASVLSARLSEAGGGRSEWAVTGLAAFGVLGLFLLGLMHVAAVRRAVARLGEGVLLALRGVFIDAPLAVLRLPAVRGLLRSWPFQLFTRYVVQPLGLCAVVWLSVPYFREGWYQVALTFLGAQLLLNSRIGRAGSEFLTGWFVHLLEWLKADFLQGLIRFVVYVFKQLIDTLEYVLYTVDEWLRFRSGDSRLSMTVRVLLGLVWFPVAYLTRLYLVVLIEPGIHPLKFPVSVLGAKLILPVLPILAGYLSRPLAPYLGEVAANAVAYFNVWWALPGAFGFLFWEMKENWKLYRANRPALLRPVAVGHHGETVLALIKPGFHAGTLPRLYTQLRGAERAAQETGSWQAVRTHRRTLREVEKVVRLFVEREFVTLLGQSPSWRGRALEVGEVDLASNRIRVELRLADDPAEPVAVAFENQAGWLVASVAAKGWLEKLTAEQAEALATALAGLYKYAGVDLVREQLRANLPPALAGAALSEDGLVLRLNVAGDEVIYPVHEAPAPGTVLVLNGESAPAQLPPARRLIFAWVPLAWKHWVEVWLKDQEGQGHAPLFGDEVVLLPNGPDVSFAPDPRPRLPEGTQQPVTADVSPRLDPLTGA
jgi:hypothetical protein